MKILHHLVLCQCLIVISSTCLFADDVYPLQDAVECTPRGGLPNFFDRLQQGENVTIAYLGGSITSQEGWRVLSQKWFEKQYPKSKITGINAAIGGTGSDLGVFRLQRDVLVHRPDLLFVEFAVNDSKLPPEKIVKTMEGIVRQTWTAYPNCDICFIYTITSKDMGALQQGKMKRSASVMQTVADYYNIPSIHMGLQVAQLEKEGKLVMMTEKGKMTRVSGDELNINANVAVNEKGVIPFSADGVHPYTDTGHVLYMNAIARSLPSIKSAGKILPHQLTVPLDPDNWEQAGILPLNQGMFVGPVAELKSGVNELAKKFSHRMPGLWEMQPGAEMSFKFKGSKASIYDVMGPNCGDVQVVLDGKKVKISRRMDGYCTYNRLATLEIGDHLDPSMVHVVSIKVLSNVFDKKKVLFEKNRGDFDKNSEKYAAFNWYPGAVLLVGEMIVE